MDKDERVEWLRGLHVVGMAAAIAVLGCSADRRSNETLPPLPDTSGVRARPTEMQLVPIDDFGTTDAGDKRLVVGRTAREVDVGFSYKERGGHPGPSVLRFATHDLDRSCVTKASLRLTLLGPVPTAVGLASYAARPSLGGLPEGAAAPRASMLLSDRPRGVYTLDGQVATADVTALVQAWLSGWQYRADERALDPAEDLTVTVQPENATREDVTRMATSESGSPTTPTLVLETRC